MQQLPSDVAALQQRILRLYGELVARRESWAKCLVVAAGTAAANRGLNAATSIAGGASLVVDPDQAAVKQTLRRGNVDFVVNTLDEAIRVLKNEIRQGRPLGVALVASPQSVARDMELRGLYPDLHIAFSTEDPAIPSRESLHLIEDEQGSLEPSAALMQWFSQHDWHEVWLDAASSSQLLGLDARMANRMPAEDTIRRRWLQRIGHYLRPSGAGERALWLTEDERENLTRAGLR